MDQTLARLTPLALGCFLVLLPRGDTGLSQEWRETLDEKLAKVAERAPGFGGMFFCDDEGTIGGAFLCLYLTDPSWQQEAETAIKEVFGAEYLKHRVKVLQGTYDFRELKAWHERMMDVLSIPRVTMTDIDESKNRLTVGLEDLGDRQLRNAVELRLVRLGVPLEAVTFEQRLPVRLTPLSM